ncbi:MAG TPA: carboxypeptidase-like regulatory domain-containing protein [Chitinophagaceae bacterium]|nr:carboxypeptidase-like regulatory domain-containing protein [Chitinophagaceae bacterium]
MKPKLLLLAIIATLSGLFAAANDAPPGTGTESTSKSDIAGGVINSETKKPVGQVVVTAYLSSKKEKVAVTDENGNYSFNDLKPGMYKFTFEKDGFKRIIKEKVLVRSDEGFQINVELNELSTFGLTPNPSNIFDFD